MKAVALLLLLVGLVLIGWGVYLYIDKPPVPQPDPVPTPTPANSGCVKAKNEIVSRYSPIIRRGEIVDWEPIPYSIPIPAGHYGMIADLSQPTETQGTRREFYKVVWASKADPYLVRNPMKARNQHWILTDLVTPADCKSIPGSTPTPTPTPGDSLAAMQPFIAAGAIEEAGQFQRTSLRIVGWALDTKRISEPIKIRVYVQQEFAGEFSADVFRADLINRVCLPNIPGAANHGFDIVIKSGFHNGDTVAVYAVNASGGPNPVIESRAIGSPINQVHPDCNTQKVWSWQTMNGQIEDREPGGRTMASLSEDQQATFALDVCITSGLLPVKNLCTTAKRRFRLGAEPKIWCDSGWHR